MIEDEFLYDILIEVLFSRFRITFQLTAKNQFYQLNNLQAIHDNYYRQFLVNKTILYRQLPLHLLLHIANLWAQLKSNQYLYAL